MSTPTSNTDPIRSSLDAALIYLRHGFSVIPLRSHGDVENRKKPLLPSWEPYQHRRPTEEEVREWFTKWPNANIGLVTGVVSGCWVLDLDGDSDCATGKIGNRINREHG